MTSTGVASDHPVVPFNDLQRGYAAHHSVIDAAVARVLESGWYVMGPEHDAFENELAAYVGVEHCVGVGNGTDALELSMVATGLRAGDHVVTVANAGAYTTTAALRRDLVPVYADVDQTTQLMTATTLLDVLTPAARAVVVTHLYGNLADVQAISQVCRERDLVLIEDCAQAAGARRDGRMAGSVGDAAAFSFYPTKNLAALGDAGAVTTGKAEVAARLRQLRQYGWSQRFSITSPGGRNSRLDEIQAAVLRARLPLLDAGNARRREIVSRYREVTVDTRLRLLGGDGDDSVAHLCVGLVDDRHAFLAALDARGVKAAVHYPTPDHLQPAVAALLGPGTALPTTESSSEKVVSLPCFPELLDEEVDHVCNVLRSIA